jgi:hypothetical protein
MKKVLLSGALATVAAAARIAAPVSAATANPTIVSGARAGSTGNYKNEITATPGSTVDMEIIVRNTTGITAGLSVDVNLPNSVTLVPGSVKGYDSANKTGSPIADSNLLNWKDLGAYGVYNASTGKGEAVITYKVKVAEASALPCGAGVINVATMVAAYNENRKTISDTVYQYVKLNVTRNCNTTVPELPTTGPVAVAATALGAGALATAAGYIVSRKK